MLRGLTGTVSRDFLLLVFFLNQFPPSPRVSHLDRLEFFRKFAEIFASKGAPPVSTTPVANLPLVERRRLKNCRRYQRHRRQILPPVSLVLLTPVANFATSFASVVDTGGKFATDVNDTGGNLPPVSTTPTANLPPCQRHRWQMMGTISGC
jgi:hypothetical protein